jgi:hypothetical protein
MMRAFQITSDDMVHTRTYSISKGRALAQAVNRWLSTLETRIRGRVRSCWICGGQNGTVTSFLLVLWFPLPIIPPIAPHIRGLL